MAFAERVAKLTDELRLSFYETLAHDLTVAIRCIWSDDAIGDAEKVERIKWVNEILHSVTAKVRVLRARSHEWTEGDFERLIAECVAHNLGNSGVVRDSLNRSFRLVTGEPLTP